MAKIAVQAEEDALVLMARTQAEALGQLYELHYERIFRFCVHRLFSKDVAEDVTSAVFLAVARKIRGFKGRTAEDFRNWLYAIAANQANAYIRKSLRRRRLMAQAAASIAASREKHDDEQIELDWPTLYGAILKLKPDHQTILTLRFFENVPLEQIAQILDVRLATLRVTLHRILSQLRNNLRSVLDGES